MITQTRKLQVRRRRRFLHDSCPPEQKDFVVRNLFCRRNLEWVENKTSGGLSKAGIVRMNISRKLSLPEFTGAVTKNKKGTVNPQ